MCYFLFGFHLCCNGDLAGSALSLQASFVSQIMATSFFSNFALCIFEVCVSQNTFEY